MPKIIIKPYLGTKSNELWWDDVLVGIYPEHSEEFRTAVRMLMVKQNELYEAERLLQQSHSPQNHPGGEQE